MAKAKLNPATDTPKNLIDITKSFMKEYVKLQGEEAKQWFKSIVAQNAVEKTIKGVKRKDYNVPVVRRLFAEKYFPSLIKRSSSVSDFDEIMSW